MCKPLPHPRCSSHAKSAYQAALRSGDPARIKQARINFYTTPQGIKMLQEAGKDELAQKYRERREHLISQYKKAQQLQRQPMTIGLDLDNTTGDFTDALRQDVAKKLNIDPAILTEPGHYSYAESGWFESEEDFKKNFHLSEKDGLYLKMAAYPDAVKTLQTLADMGYKIKIITARDRGMEADTRAWLRKNRIPFHSLVFSSNKKEHDADVYIDDAPSNINDLRANGKNVITFTQKYNEDIPGARVKAWKQLSRRLAAMQNKDA